MVTTLEYTNGRLSKVIDPANRETLFEHDADGNLIKITDPDGTFRQFSYDADHKLVSKTSKRGHTSAYSYDFAGRFTQSVRPDGSIWSLEPKMIVGLADTANGQGTKTNPAPVMQEEDNITTITDGNGNASTFKLNEFGTVIELTDSVGRTTVISRDENNNVIQRIDPRGHIIDNIIDMNGNVLTSTKQSLGATTTFTYTTDGFNNVKSITDANGNTTVLNYDSNGNILSMVDAQNNTTSFTYNSRGQILVSLDPMNNSKASTYDPSTGNLLSTSDQNFDIKEFTYDTAGNVLTVTDALSRSTLYSYDSMNRISQNVDADLAVMTYNYDANGGLIKVTDFRNKITTFQFDALDRLISRKDPIGNSDFINYDMNGNINSTTDRQNQTIVFEYNTTNQLIRMIQPENIVTTYSYDNSNNPTSIIDPDSSLTMVYDAGNRLISVNTTGSPNLPDVTLNYTYDLVGYKLTMTDNISGTTNYDYDTLNRLKSITNPMGKKIDISSDALGRIKQFIYPNNSIIDLTYDPKSQVISVINTHGTNTISSFDYTYDAVGNRTNMNILKTGVTVTNSIDYDYDNLSRVVQATNILPSQPNESFNYDLVGNRLNTTGQTSNSIFDDTNRLIEDEQFSYQYNANGNLISKTDKSSNEMTSYEYDAENQLIQILAVGNTISYRYDGLGRRIEKNINGQITRFIYDNENILFQFDANNNPQSRFTHSDIIDTPLIMNVLGSDDYYYHYDGIGSITELTDDSGNIVQSYIYDTFGNIISNFGILDNPFTYTGRQFDEESGLYYYRARYYDPEIGRFITEDPMSFLGGDINFYAYVGNNPTVFTDPFGLYKYARWISEPRVTGVTANFVENVYGPAYWSLFPPSIGVYGRKYFISGKITGVVECIDDDLCGEFIGDIFTLDEDLRSPDFIIGVGFIYAPAILTKARSFYNIGQAVGFYFNQWSQLARQYALNPLAWCFILGNR